MNNNILVIYGVIFEYEKLENIKIMELVCEIVWCGDLFIDKGRII